MGSKKKAGVLNRELKGRLIANGLGQDAFSFEDFKNVVGRGRKVLGAGKGKVSLDGRSIGIFAHVHGEDSCRMDQGANTFDDLIGRKMKRIGGRNHQQSRIDKQPGDFAISANKFQRFLFG